MEVPAPMVWASSRDWLASSTDGFLVLARERNRGAAIQRVVLA